MPRHKSARNCSIPDWMSARPDNSEGRFIQVGNSLLLSRKFGELKASSQILYICMAMEAGGKREFTFPESAAKKYHFSTATFRRSLAELIEHDVLQYTSMEREIGKTPQLRFTVAAFKEEHTNIKG